MKIKGQISRLPEENVAKVDGATSSDVYRLVKVRRVVRQCSNSVRPPVRHARDLCKTVQHNHHAFICYLIRTPTDVRQSYNTADH